MLSAALLAVKRGRVARAAGQASQPARARAHARHVAHSPRRSAQMRSMRRLSRPPRTVMYTIWLAIILRLRSGQALGSASVMLDSRTASNRRGRVLVLSTLRHRRADLHRRD
jgi:hypothetical protein